MQNELKITFNDMAHSDAVEARIREKAAKLEKLFPRLTGCQVTVSEPHRHQQRHRLLAVGIKISFPGGEVAVTRDDNEDVYVLLRDAFAAAGRELEKNLGRRKTRAASHHALNSDRPGIAQESDHE
jgi:ribosomal subunit interface protein